MTNILLCLRGTWRSLQQLPGSLFPPLEGSLPHLLSWCHPLPQGPSSGPRVALLGMQSILCAASCRRSSINCLNWASPRSLRVIWNCGGGPPSGWGSLGGPGHHLPIWDLCWGNGGVPAPHSYIISDMGAHGRIDMEPYRFVTPHHDHTSEMFQDHHLHGRLVCKTSASVSKTSNTPFGCTWPKPRHNPTKSSSWKES